MSTETLKISLVQKILEVSDTAILEEIYALLDKGNRVIGYSVDGTPVLERQYIQEMDILNQQINEGTVKHYTVDEVKKRIVNGNNLAQ